jgi:hypothetical protein
MKDLPFFKSIELMLVFVESIILRQIIRFGLFRRNIIEKIIVIFQFRDINLMSLILFDNFVIYMS